MKSYQDSSRREITLGQALAITSVKEWLAANRPAFVTNWYLDEPEDESEKAILVECLEYRFWLPKSQCIAVINDHYTECLGKTMWLVPTWLRRKNMRPLRDLGHTVG